jgi:hypothetical protein
MPVVWRMASDTQYIQTVPETQTNEWQNQHLDKLLYVYWL